MIDLNVCEWCWFNVFVSDNEICPICNYQNSILWLLHPYESDANAWLTLLDYQKWTLDHISNDIKEYEEWGKIYYRNNDWRPINILNFNKDYEYYPAYFFNRISNENRLIYNKELKRFKLAQKHNPDHKVHLEL